MKQIPEDIITSAQASQQAWHVPACVSIAQWAIESGWGAHCPGNNPFGIKALPGFPVQNLMTTEVIHGRVVHETQPFAKFPTIDAAFDAHARLIARNHVYAAAMAALPDVDAFVPLMAAHYATDPLYASKVMALINGHHLRQYDIRHP